MVRRDGMLLVSSLCTSQTYVQACVRGTALLIHSASSQCLLLFTFLDWLQFAIAKKIRREVITIFLSGYLDSSGTRNVLPDVLDLN